MPSQISHDSRRAAALGLVLFALYVATLCPTVFRGDSGEIISAIWSDTVIHPPGYPLFTQLGKIFLYLVPLGEPAFRIGVLVALCGALAIAFLYRVIRELEVSHQAALGAAALFGVSLTFWSQCNRVEVYSLHLMLAFLATWQCLHYRRTGEEHALYRACGAVGLGLAHHLTIVLLIPGLLVLCGGRLWSLSGLARRLLVGVCLLALCGLPLYGLLWSKLESSEAFWAHVTGRAYQLYWNPPTSLEALQRPLSLAGAIFAENGFVPLSVLMLLGAFTLVRRNLGALVGLVVMALTVIAYCFCYTIEDIASYYLVPMGLGTVLVGVALGEVERILTHRQHSQITRALACSVLPLLGLVLNFQVCNLRSLTGVRLLAEQKLKACAPSSFLLCQGDEDTYSLRYVHQLLKVRPDVTVLEPDTLEHTGIALLERGNRPLASTYFGTSAANQAQLGETLALTWVQEHYTPCPRGVILELTPKAVVRSLDQVLTECRNAWATIDLPELPLAPTATEVDGDYTRRHYVTMLCNYAYLYEQAQQAEQASKVYLVALNYAPELTRKALESMQGRSLVAKQLLGQLSQNR